MYEYRQIIMHMRAGQSDRNIAQQKLAGRRKCQTIRVIAKQQGWLDSARALPSDKELADILSAPKPTHRSESRVMPYKDHILKWHGQGINNKTIYQALVSRFGYNGSYDSVYRFVKKHASQVRPTCALHFDAGDAVQVDFGRGPDIVDVDTGEIIKSWFFVMSLCYSRHMYVEFVADQKIQTWLGCHKRAFEFFGGVPKRVIIDNAKCAIIKACRYDPEVQRSYADYAQGYGFMIAPCPPREPQMKGRVESGVKYVKGSFLPLRTFRSLADANAQAKAWVLGVAGNRCHGTTRQQPLELFEQTERYLLQPLPINPPEVVSWHKVKVHNDCHVQHAKSRYSVPHVLVGKTLWLKASEHTVGIYHDYELIAQHLKSPRPGRVVTLQQHLPPNAQAYLMRDASWCRKQAAQVGSDCLEVVERLFADKVVDHLRGAQGILSLAKRYGSARVNAACKRALAFNSCRYMTIKKTLQNGLEYAPLPQEEAFDLLGQAYTQGRFIRNPDMNH
jgi:transposase